MNKEKEIEEMANELHSATNESYISCRKIARILVERRGYRKSDEVRKETAKEMLQELDSRLWDGIDTNADIGGAEHNQTIRSLMKFIKSKYGVTKDDNATH